MTKTKSLRTLLFITAFLVYFISCSGERMLHKTYTGQDLAAGEAAVFNWEGTWYMGLGLYKVDGHPYTGGFEGGTWECMYNDKNHGGFNVAVRPGERVFEFFAVDSSPVKVFQIKFNLLSGKTYTLKGDSKKYAVICDGAEVKITVEPIPVYYEPAVKERHGTLSLKLPEDTPRVALFRIDERVGVVMYKFHPKWVSINDLTADHDIIYEVRLTPGRHTIEYVVFGGANAFYGYNHMGSSVKTLNFFVKEGRTYSYRVIEDPAKGKSGRFEHTIELIEL